MAQDFTWAMSYTMGANAGATFRVAQDAAFVTTETARATNKLRVEANGTINVSLPEFKELLVGFRAFLDMVLTRYGMPRGEDETISVEIKLTPNAIRPTECEFKVGVPPRSSSFTFSDINLAADNQKVKMQVVASGALATPATFYRSNFELTQLIARNYRIFSQPVV